jgi:hypothetical protein
MEAAYGWKVSSAKAVPFTLPSPILPVDGPGYGGVLYGDSPDDSLHLMVPGPYPGEGTRSHLQCEANPPTAQTPILVSPEGCRFLSTFFEDQIGDDLFLRKSGFFILSSR